MASAGFIRALIIACNFSHFAIDLTYSIKKSIIRMTCFVLFYSYQAVRLMPFGFVLMLGISIVAFYSLFFTRYLSLIIVAPTINF